MKIDIQTLNFPLSDALRSYIERCLNFTMSSKDAHIRRIMVRLSDINGPRGGADKCCQIQVVLTQLPDVIIKDTKVDLYNAIHRATDRASRTIERRIARQRDKKRSSSIDNTLRFPNDLQLIA